jgi:hypothetical protein
MYSGQVFFDGGYTVSFVGAVLVWGFKEGACSFIPLSLLTSKIWVTHEHEVGICM